MCRLRAVGCFIFKLSHLLYTYSILATQRVHFQEKQELASSYFCYRNPSPPSPGTKTIPASGQSGGVEFMTSELQVQHSAKLPSPITESIVQSTYLNSFQSWNELVHSGKHKLIRKLPLFDLLPFLEEFLDIPPDIFKGLFEERANFNCLLCFLICLLCLWFEDFCRVQICPCLQAEQESKKN